MVQTQQPLWQDLWAGFTWATSQSLHPKAQREGESNSHCHWLHCVLSPAMHLIYKVRSLGLSTLTTFSAGNFKIFTGNMQPLYLYHSFLFHPWPSHPPFPLNLPPPLSSLTLPIPVTIFFFHNGPAIPLGCEHKFVPWLCINTGNSVLWSHTFTRKGYQKLVTQSKISEKAHVW